MAATLGTETPELLDSVDLVPSVFAPPRCEDCKFWTRPLYDGRGVCQRTAAIDGVPLDPDSSAIAFGWGSGVLNTAPDHFCSMFEEKRD